MDHRPRRARRCGRRRRTPPPSTLAAPLAHPTWRAQDASGRWGPSRVMWTVEDHREEVRAAVEADFPEPTARVPRGRRLGVGPGAGRAASVMAERDQLDEVAVEVAGRRDARVTGTDVAVAARLVARRPALLEQVATRSRPHCCTGCRGKGTTLVVRTGRTAALVGAGLLSLMAAAGCTLGTSGAPAASPPSSLPASTGALALDNAAAALPAAGTCHFPAGVGLTLPDPVCTPGAVNPAVTPTTTAQLRLSAAVGGRRRSDRRRRGPTE